MLCRCYFVVREGSQVNAFRHALWTATISNWYGSNIARDAVRSHEELETLTRGDIMRGFSNEQISRASFGSLLEADGMCDYLNNEIALQMEWDSVLPTNEIALVMLDAYHDTGFWVAVDKGDGTFRLQKDILGDEQYAVARARLSLLNCVGFYAE